MEMIDYLPAWIKDFGITYRGTSMQWWRRGRYHRERMDFYKNLRHKDQTAARAYQQERFAELFHHVKNNSPYYAQKYAQIDEPDISNIPVLEKEELRSNIDAITIGDKRKHLEVYTGGTTGKAISIYLSRRSMQERIALLDLFWEMHHYRLGIPCAWFSGRNILGQNDRRQHIYWRNNWWMKVRYYSTFDMSPDTLPYYIDNINRFSPRFLSGFPSGIYELARFSQDNNLPFTFQPQAIFTTSETLRDDQRSVIEAAFGCPVRDQYSSSEGVPWIIECPHGRKHLDLGSGILEILDENGQPSDEGDVVGTSFTMWETPIIRYRVGDRLRLSSESSCPCGWDTPLADRILGRTTDFIEIPGRGKLWASQIGDCVKGVHGIIRFQVERLDDRLQVNVVRDPIAFTVAQREYFLHHLRERVGDFPIEIIDIEDIERTTGGKLDIIRRTPKTTTTTTNESE